MMSTSHFGWSGRCILRVSYGCYLGFSTIPHQEKHSNCTLFLIEMLECDKVTEEVPECGCAISPEFSFQQESCCWVAPSLGGTMWVGGGPGRNLGAIGDAS